MPPQHLRIWKIECVTRPTGTPATSLPGQPKRQPSESRKAVTWMPPLLFFFLRGEGDFLCLARGNGPRIQRPSTQKPKSVNKHTNMLPRKRFCARKDFGLGFKKNGETRASKSENLTTSSNSRGHQTPSPEKRGFLKHARTASDSTVPLPHKTAPVVGFFFFLFLFAALEK